MIDILILIVLVCLIFVSYLDLEYRAIPSVFLTGLLFFVAIVRIDFIQYGILAGIFAMLIKDLIHEFNGLDFGIADIKILIILGLMLHTRAEFFVLMGIFAVFQFAYTLIWTWRCGEENEMPFVPCLLAVYIATMLLRCFA